MNHSRTVLLIALVEALSACTAMTSNCKTGEQNAVQETLFFGTGKADGKVSAEEWADFLFSEVTPLFPQGLTVWPAAGQWRSAGGTIVKEDSYVLTLIHQADKASDAAMRQIIDHYKTGFQQESVFRAVSPVCVSY